MIEWITRLLCEKWEVKDNLPEDAVDAIAGMSLSPLRSGKPGGHIENVVEQSVREFVSRTGVKWLIFSNYLKADGGSVAVLEMNLAIQRGITREAIVIPRCHQDRLYRNTFEEARFALQILKFLEDESILIVANNIHMRRVIKTFEKVNQGHGLVLYWRSVGRRSDYHLGYRQWRFTHPLFFLFREYGAMIYSKLVGWI